MPAPPGPTRRPPLSDSVRYDVAAGVATLTFNRPDSLNALTYELKNALIAALARARDDADVRAVILTGAGRAFCVGQDLREHAEALAAGDAAVENTVRDHYNVIASSIATMPKPVVAAINGTAAGAGAAFAYAADFRFAADNASFVMAFAKIGLGADSGASWTLPRLIGHGRATALMMLGEPISAAQALEMGLVNGVVAAEDLAGAVRELATKLAAGPTTAYAAIKDALLVAAAADLETALEHEAVVQARCGRTADHRNATEAFLAKREAQFTGR